MAARVWARCAIRRRPAVTLTTPFWALTLYDQFAQHLARLRIDEDVFEWIVRALRESCSYEKREHNDAIARLQAEWNRLQKRIDAMYVDKLDGRIEEGFYMRLRTVAGRAGALRARHRAPSQGR